MSEYWKSTPNYWCKHCSTYVRDTKLERANHEAKSSHQNALKRALRDLYRSHEREERESDRAKAEIERLRGLTSGSSSRSGGGGAGPPVVENQQATEADRQRQMEQLAALGVSIPTDFRGDLAMPGEWTVTSTKVINEDEKKEERVEAKAIGVRKREQTEEEREEEEAMRGLFKKPRKWGRGTKTMGGGEDAELDALLSGDFVKPEKIEEPDADKIIKEDVDNIKTEEDAGDAKGKDAENVKKEEDDSAIKQEPGLDIPSPPVAAVAPSTQAGGESDTSTPTPAPVFKKRKPKNFRQK